MEHHFRIRMKFSLVMVCMAIAPLASADVASSANYSFVYAGVGSAGAPAQSTNYSTVGLVKTSGATLSPSSSASYSVQHVIGKSLTTLSAIADWHLY